MWKFHFVREEKIVRGFQIIIFISKDLILNFMRIETWKGFEQISLTQAQDGDGDNSSINNSKLSNSPLQDEKWHKNVDIVQKKASNRAKVSWLMISNDC